MPRTRGQTEYFRREWWAGESLSPISQRIYDRVISFSKRDLIKNSLVLDAGCGPGELLWRLYNLTGKVVGTDMDLESLQIASQRLKNRGIPSVIIEKKCDPNFEFERRFFNRRGVYLVQDNFLDTRFANGFFDHIFFILTDVLDYGIVGISTSPTYGTPPMSERQVGLSYEARARAVFVDLLRKHGRVTECLMTDNEYGTIEKAKETFSFLYGDLLTFAGTKFYEEPGMAEYALDAEPDVRVNGYSIIRGKKGR